MILQSQLPAYRLVAIDLDDTLLDDNLEISPANRASIQRAREAGVVVTIATGRMYQSALPFARELGLDIPLITYQGALIKNALTGETILHRPVPASLARRVLNAARAKGLHTNFYINDQLLMENLSSAGQNYARLARVEPQLVPDLSQVLEADPTKVLLIGDEAELDKLLPELKETFQQELHITKSKPNFLEFIHPKATKGNAIVELARHFGVDLSQVIAIGDSYNDVEMLQVAGCAVVMGNAREEIKQWAHYVTTSNNDNGVAKALEELLFNREG